MSDPTESLSEMLTWEEICERYPSQWVTLVEIAGPWYKRPATARVWRHAKTPGVEHGRYHTGGKHEEGRYDEKGRFIVYANLWKYTLASRG